MNLEAPSEPRFARAICDLRGICATSGDIMGIKASVFIRYKNHKNIGIND